MPRGEDTRFDTGRQVDRYGHGARNNYFGYSDRSGGGAVQDPNSPFPNSPAPAPFRPAGPMGRLVNKGLDMLGAPETSENGVQGGRVAKKPSRKDRLTEKVNNSIYDYRMSKMEPGVYD